MKLVRTLVGWFASAIFVLWLFFHFDSIQEPQHGDVRLVLGVFFGLCIFFRSKADDIFPVRIPSVVLAIAGTLFTIIGIVFNVNQFEWLGLIILLFASLTWALPDRYFKDTLLALLIIYWMHPLPGQLFSQFQFMMQNISVNGAESILQAFNVRVWADQFVLHTGARVFSVPEECSGMATATTVLMCTLGVGILLRLRWYEVIAFLFIGLLQVLVFNIVRICFMVVWSARMPPEWSQNFLHDTLSIFLLVTILLTQAEASWWKAFRSRRRERMQAIERGEMEPPEKASILPRFWTLVKKLWIYVFALIVFAGAIVFFAYKNRPYHRVEMIKDVVDGLIQRNRAAAERAIEEGLSFYPHDRRLLARKLRVLVMEGEFSEALDVAQTLGDMFDLNSRILKSWALMGLGKIEAASELISNLPESQQRRPAVAIVKAEYSAIKDIPDQAGKAVVLASNSSDLVERVRALFPYLALREQWQAIVEADRMDIPYHRSVNALIAVKAYRRVGDVSGASTSLSMSLDKWPEDPHFLSSLFDLARHRPGSCWEKAFARNLKANIDNLSKAELASYMDYSFRLVRPDLGWLAYLALESRDSTDPALYLTAAKHSGNWFVFRKHFLGLEAKNETEVIDLKPMCLSSRQIWPWESLWSEVPLDREMLTHSSTEVRAKYLGLCLAELERRRKADMMTRRMRMIFPIVLGMLGEYESAHKELDRLAIMYPDKKPDIIFQHALFYHNQGKWPDLYETLRQYEARVQFPNLTADLMKINALMNMNLGVQAMNVARQASRKFPGSKDVEGAIAAIWDVFGYKEQALFVLMRANPEILSRPIVQLFSDTGRFYEAEKMSRALGVQVIASSLEAKQHLFPPPAELTVMRRWPEPLSGQEMLQLADKLRNDIEECSSPFVKKLMLLKVSWYEDEGKGDVVSDVSPWLDAGRDNIEKASALHHLSVMQARQKMFKAAAASSYKASELLPDSEVIWRTLIAVTEGDQHLVDRAFGFCPEDPHIWLASLVTALRQKATPEAERKNLEHISPSTLWLSNQVSKAVQKKTFSPGVMVRAGDLILRAGNHHIASVAARDAVQRANGLISAYSLGLRVSLRTQDVDWGLSCALEGVQNARNPTPFYKTIIAVKNIRDKRDKDLLSALQYLSKEQPDRSIWSEQLGSAYFERGDMKRALSVLGPAIRENLRGVQVQSLLLAAEAARFEGELRYAIDILEAAHALYPDRLSVLNNFVYNLAQDGKLISRAKAMIPGLLRKDNKSPAVLDTVAYVYRMSGDLEKAQTYMNMALANLEGKGSTVSEIRVNAAELAFEQGQYEEARKHLDALKGFGERNDVVTRKMKELTIKLEEVR